MSAGASHNLAAGHTSSIRRIEGGMLSYHADMDIHTNPYELGLDRLVDLDVGTNFIGKTALQNIRDTGVLRKQVGLEISGPPLTGPNTTFWPVTNAAKHIGKVTSAVYSPRLKKNIALAMVESDSSEPGTQLEVQQPTESVSATIVKKPFYDPNKKITTA